MCAWQGLKAVWHLIPPPVFPTLTSKWFEFSSLTNFVFQLRYYLQKCILKVFVCHREEVFSVLEWVLFIIFVGWLLISNKNQKQTRDFKERLIGQICLGRNRRARKTSEPAPGGRPRVQVKWEAAGWAGEAQQGQLTRRAGRCQRQALPTSAIFISEKFSENSEIFLVGYSWRFWNGLQRSLSGIVYTGEVYAEVISEVSKNPFQVPEEHWWWGLGRKRELLSR